MEVTLRVDCGKKRRADEKRHYFSWEELPSPMGRQRAERSVVRPDPVRLAREWQASMAERGESRADLARRLGISRARVTQIVGILDLAPELLEELERQSGSLEVSERALRMLQALPPALQRERMAKWTLKSRRAEHTPPVV